MASNLEQNTHRFATRAIHNGCEPELITGSVSSPIYMTSTYAQESPGKHKGYEYTRSGNPNFTQLEEQLKTLENGLYCCVVSSGLAAVAAIFGDLHPGDVIVCINSLYGGTLRLLQQWFKPKGIIIYELLFQNLHLLEKVFIDVTHIKYFLFETPTNPLMDILNIKELCATAHRFNILCVVDNTFGTPYHQHALTLGADIVIHSTTKYISGHSDVLGGAIITNLKHIDDSVKFQRKCVGFVPSPFDCWLLSRSLKTLALRMEKHSTNAQAIAEFLFSNPLVSKVYYPGLQSHPTHEIARQQMKNGFGGMLSVEFNLPVNAVKIMISNFKIFVLAASLGGVESLVNHPASMTHASIPLVDRLAIGITDGLVRFSIGIEAVDDLVDDIQNALNIAAAENT